MFQSRTPEAPSGRGRRRRRIGMTIVSVIAAIGLTVAVLPNLQNSADALPICPTLPCDPPTTTGTVPPPPTWNVNLLHLQQDLGGTGTISADRSWLSNPVICCVDTVPIGQADEIAAQTASKTATAGADPTAAKAATAATSPILLGTLTPAGSSGLIGNQFKFPTDPMPSGARMFLRVKESGAPGSLCRTTPVTPLPASGVPLHILTPAPVSTSAAALAAMVSGFSGPQSGTPDGTSVYIGQAGLAPTPQGLQLSMLGAMKVYSWTFFFAYNLTFTLTPSNGVNTSNVLSATAPNPGSLSLGWFSPKPSNGDAIVSYISPTIESTLRNAVVAKATPIVNNAVTQSHDVIWWGEQGFTPSVRKVTYSATDMKVYPSLCKLG
jgi:hypothetical protein